MRAIATIATSALALLGNDSPNNDAPYITKSFIDNMKDKVNFDVYSHENHPFANYSLSEVQKRLGVLDELRSNDAVTYGDLQINAELPEIFDAREQWPDCVGPIRDQGSCGSCWAVAVASTYSDRACIAKQTDGYVYLSPQELVSCDDVSSGCNGGYSRKAWDYIMNHGLVTETCFPYTSGKTQSSGKCLTKDNECVKAPGKDREDFELFTAQDTRSVPSVVAAKEAIIKNGPIVASFQVYEDLMNYRGGIYVHKTGGLLGAHAVRVIGWGAENGVEFWIVANSWAERWGEKGFFRVAIGQSKLSFEGNLSSGLPNSDI